MKRSSRFRPFATAVVEVICASSALAVFNVFLGLFALGCGLMWVVAK